MITVTASSGDWNMAFISQRPGFLALVIVAVLFVAGAAHADDSPLRKAYEGKAKPVLMVPVGHVLLELQERMRLGKVPGFTDQQSILGNKAGDEREVSGVKLCWCPPGRFLMGSPPGESERRPDETQVEVTLTRGFWTGQYEVTQGQWKRVVGEFPGKQPTGEGDDFPLVEVNYAEAEGFCRTLTQQARKAGNLPNDWEFRLPTEAQWEYACRAGTTMATAFGDKLSSRQANFQGMSYNRAEQGPSLKRAAQVGSYPANAWGLHDMHGNVYEWCRDWYHRQLPGGDDPDLSAIKGTRNRDVSFSRVRRGGAWCDDGWPCRSAFRVRFEPERRSDHIGFRVVVVPH
jgi:formylglycine-generating enzyme